MASSGARANAAPAADAPKFQMDERGLPPWPALVAYVLMAFGMFMAILDIQIVSASLSQIQAGLSASADEISWVQTSYLIAEVVMIPLSGFLARALSIKWLFVISSAGFTVASFLCSTATTIEEMVVYRAIQGFVGGAMIPLLYSAGFVMFGRARQGALMVIVSLIVTFAPTIGPTLGGWLSDRLGWEWLFLINIIPGILITFGVWALVDIDEPNFDLLKRIDFLGLLAMALFLGGLDYVLEEGARHEWFEDGAIFTWACVAALAAAVFFWRAATAPEPIVRLAPFANMNFAGGALLGAVFGIGLYGLVYLYPLFLARVANLSSGQIGTTLLATGVAMMVSAPIAGQLVRRIDPRALLALGLLSLSLSTYLTSFMTVEWRLPELIWPQVIRGFGLMCCIVSISNTAFATLPSDQLKDAPGLFTLLRNLGGAVGLALINTVILTRYNLHWARLTEATNPARPEIQARLDMMRELAASRGYADPDAAAVRMLAGQVDSQALVMSYADCFLLLSIMFAAVAVIPFLLKRPPTMEQVAASAEKP
jgi:MFS transporter, DHA2 family, multidrug resistance protein